MTALNAFHADKGYYPPAPYYDESAGRYRGGFSELYPDYITDRDLLICPDDQQALAHLGDCHDRVYCSYNGLIDWNTWHFRTLSTGGAAILYNYYGYTYQFKLDPADPERIDEAAADNGWSSGYDTGQSGCILPGYVPGWMDGDTNGIPDFLETAGLSWQHFPRLFNRSAPDNTIVTHCPHHRKYYDNPDKKMDIVVTLGGQTRLVNVTDLGDPNKTGVAGVAGWVHQNF